MICLDTSILIELHLGNPLFTAYARQDFVINDLILSEFCGFILKKHGERASDYWFRKLSEYSEAVSKDLLYEAVKLRWKLKNKKISFIDVATYVFSQQHDCVLITTDNDFRGLPGVEIISR